MAFRNAVETDFITPASQWPVTLPNTARIGDYLLALIASPTAGIGWGAPGWEPLDGFSTASSDVQSFPLSYGVFGKFLTPIDDVTGTIVPIFTVAGAIGGSATGVVLCAAYSGVSRAQPIRSRSLGTTPVTPPFNPVTSASFPGLFASAGDMLLAPMVTAGNATNVILPGLSFTLRASTVGGVGVVIALADETLATSGLQTGTWTASMMPTPLVTEAIALWPDAGHLMQPVVLYAALDQSPAHFRYENGQPPTVIVNTAGLVFKVYAGPQEAPPSLISSSVLSGVSLLLTRPDGSTLSQPLQSSPDGRYGWCVSNNTWFPYTGVYYLQLQLQWANGSVQYSSQAYLTGVPQGGQ